MDEQEEKSNISNFEWFFVIGAVGVVDLIEFLIELLDLSGIGIFVAVVVTGFMDIVVGCSLFMYCFIRGIKLTPARTLALLGGFLLELFPFVGGAPLWTLDVVFIMLSVKAEEGKLGALAVAGAELAAGKLSAKASGGAKPLVISAPKAAPGAVPPIIPKTGGGRPPVIARAGSAGALNTGGIKSMQSRPGGVIEPSSLPGQRNGPLPVPGQRRGPPPLPGQPQETGVKSEGVDYELSVGTGRDSARERIEKLRGHAADYRQDIKSRTDTYGETARAGQRFIKGDREANQ